MARARADVEQTPEFQDDQGRRGRALAASSLSAPAWASSASSLVTLVFAVVLIGSPPIASPRPAPIVARPVGSLPANAALSPDARRQRRPGRSHARPQSARMTAHCARTCRWPGHGQPPAFHAAYALHGDPLRTVDVFAIPADRPPSGAERSFGLRLPSPPACRKQAAPPQPFLTAHWRYAVLGRRVERFYLCARRSISGRLEWQAAGYTHPNGDHSEADMNKTVKNFALGGRGRGGSGRRQQRRLRARQGAGKSARRRGALLARPARRHLLHTAGQGPAVVLLHGIYAGASGYEWRKNFDALSEHFNVYAPDWLGFGLSDKPRIRYTDAVYVEQLARFLREVVQEPCVLVASSLATAYAVQVAHDAPDLVQSLILVCPTGFRHLAHTPDAGAEATYQTAPSAPARHDRLQRHHVRGRACAGT